MFGPIRNFVFDMDGTLIDSMPHAIEGFRRAVKHASGADLQDEELYRVLGQSPQAMLAAFLPPEKLSAGIESWLLHNKVTTKDQVPFFEGIPELLSAIAENKSLNLGVFTGRDRDGSLTFFRAHGWLGTLIPEKNIRCGDDGFLHKPSGEAIVDLLEKNSWKPEETLYVGDSPLDIQAGKDAGVKTAAALWDEFFSKGSTARARYRERWQTWDALEVDMRLPSPSHLKTWVLEQRF